AAWPWGTVAKPGSRTTWRPWPPTAPAGSGSPLPAPGRTRPGRPTRSWSATGPERALSTGWGQETRLPDLSRAVCHECVAVHLERAGVAFAVGAGEGVDRVAGHHAGEPAVVQHLLPARTGQPAGYSTGPQVDVAPGRGGHRAAGGDVGDLQPPAGAQHPEDLGEYGRLVGAQVDHPVGDHHVGPAGGDRERFGEAVAELDVRQAEFLGGAARFGQHFGGHVDAGHLPAGADPGGGDE